MRQAGMDDPKGEYVHHWLPELRAVPNAYIHEPHRMSIDEQKQAECRVGVEYPKPIVNLEETARKFQR
jgi:deoxyribodipyrimidine photo-lyase